MLNKNNASGCKASYNACRWWKMHQWDKWEEIDVADVSHFLDSVPYKREYRMKRTCSRCGHIKLKTITQFF